MIVYVIFYLGQNVFYVLFYFFILKPYDMYFTFFEEKGPFVIMLLGFQCIMYLSVKFNT